MIMNRNLIKSMFCLMLSIVFISTASFAANNTRRNTRNQETGNRPQRLKKEIYKYNKVPIRQPVVTKNMAPAVQKYKNGDYLGAMVDLKNLVETKEPKNTYAKYYLALCYTQLGYKSEATEYYQEVVNDNSSYSLSYYAKRGLTCIDNPNDDVCKPPKKASIPTEPMNEEEEYQSDTDDITTFIRSGKQIHPAALDKITKERMERKLQADMYAIKEAEKNKELQQDNQ